MNDATRAESFALHVSDVMMILNTSKLKRQPDVVGGAQYHLRHFDKAEPYSLVQTTHADVPDAGYFTDGTPWDLAESLDVVAANRISDGGRLYGEDFAVRRYRRVKRPYLPVRPLKRHLIEEAYLAINTKDGVARTVSSFFGSNGPSDPWVELDPLGYAVTGNRTPEEVERKTTLLRLAVGMQITRDYQWRVHLKYNGADIGVVIPSTSAGIRALFRLRDYEAGESRRKALAHWVDGHWRKVRKDTPEEDLIWVRDHLRGSLNFTWNDMRGTVSPSADDLRRLEELRR